MNPMRHGSAVVRILVGVLALTAQQSHAGSSQIAAVNGRIITEDELRLSLSGFNEAQRTNYLKDSNSRQQVISNLIDREVLVILAEAKRMDQSQDYKDALAQFRKQFLATVYVEKAIAPQMNEAAAKAFFNLHQERYTTDRVRAQHVLLPTEAEAFNVLKLAKVPDTDFQSLAEKYSIDPSAKNNRGELAFFQRDAMSAEFTDPVFAAKVGQVIGPIKTLYGYHIVKVLERKTGTKLQYDEVELRVKADLRQELVGNLLAASRKGMKISVMSGKTTKNPSR